MKRHRPRHILMCLLLLAVLTALSCTTSNQGNGGPTPDGDTDTDTDTPGDGDSSLPDGDTLDGDSTDSDGDLDLVTECKGACASSDPTFCAASDLCICRDGRFAVQNCQKTCQGRGLGDSTGCAFIPETQRFDCRCTESPSVCGADITISELPFTHQGDTRGRPNAFGLVSSCFDWAVPGPDFVYRLDPQPGQNIRITLTPLTATYDPALVLASSCSSHADCIDGRDRGWSGVTEQLTYAVTTSQPLWLLVDSGYKPEAPESSGRYTLEVIDLTSIPDGDMDGDEEAETDFDGDTDDDLEDDADTDSDTDEDPDGDPDDDTDADTDEDTDPDGDIDGEPEDEDTL